MSVGLCGIGQNVVPTVILQPEVLIYRVILVV